MSGKRYIEVMEKIGTLNTEVKDIFDKAGDDPLDKETYQKVTGNNKQIHELEVEAKELIDQAGAKEAANRRAEEAKRPADGSQLRTPNANPGQQSKDGPVFYSQSLGDQLLSDPEFKAWRESKLVGGAKGTELTRGALGASPAIQLKTLLTGTSSTSAGAFVINDRLNIVDPGTSRRPLTIRQLLTNGRTGSDTVEYVRQGAHTNNAAVVAEASATTGITGAKPESAMVFSIVTEAVKTIAHWIPATRRALADVGQLMTMINAWLYYGLEEKLETQVLLGDGVGDNFTGILNTSGITAQAWDTNILATTRKGRTKVRTTGRGMPSAYLFHPNDWQTIDLLQDNEARYLFGGPSVLGNPRLWGLPVVESEAITEGIGLVADWSLAALWDREQAQIMVSDSHSDFFTRNLIAVLAEMRAAFGVIRPAAFVSLDLTA